MTPGVAKGLAHEYFPYFLEQRSQARALDRWGRGEANRENLYIPRDQEQASREYLDIADVSPTPWLMFVVTALLQTIYAEGMIQRDGGDQPLKGWETWQRNGFDAKQVPLYRAIMDHGVAHVVALPGKDPLTGDAGAIWSPRSAMRTATFYREVGDDWAELAISAQRVQVQGRASDGHVLGAVDGFEVELIDSDGNKHVFDVISQGLELKDWSHKYTEIFDLGICPVVQYTFQTDLDGNPMGQIEPFIPLAKRIDQDTFDRLIVQRKGAWKVRYATGLVRPQGMTDAEYRMDMLQLKVGDFLAAPSPETKFGQLDEMDLTRLIAARDSDLRDLSATSQTPPHHMLGLSSNLQAESLAAAEAGLQRKGAMFKINVGESHERLFRLNGKIIGAPEETRAVDLQTRWQDRESRSLEQAAQALGTLVTQVGVPAEMAFEKIPGWTDLDVERAKKLLETQAIDDLMTELDARLQQGQQAEKPAGPQSAPVV